MTKQRVLVMGGGVGGLSAAHELVQRDFDVTVLERQTLLGGKARSLDVPDSAPEGRRALPGEHGFRFFPGFYQHLDVTMAEIPYPTPEATGRVSEQLTKVDAFAIARGDGELLELPTDLTDDFFAVRKLLGTAGKWDVSFANLWFIGRQLAWLLSIPRAERRELFDGVSWWEFTEASTRGTDDPEYLRYFVDGITRSMVACRAQEMNAYTAGTIFLQLLRSVVRSDSASDRVLKGPTSERWIDPWVAWLRSRHVDIRTDSHIERLDVKDNRVVGAHVRGPDGPPRVEHADWYVAAVPVERMVELVSNGIGRADPTLLTLSALKTEWMNGVMLYLRDPLDLSPGHVIYSRSPWALTSAEHQNHWTDGLSDFGDGTVGGILSVDVSEWDVPGIVYGKPARLCTKDEITHEVREQIRTHVPRHVAGRLDPSNIVRGFVDPSIVERRGGHVNEEPLLVNTTGSWGSRPKARTALENLVIAADYVQTNTNLACMEGANEAARRAVNIILEATGYSGPKGKCAIFDLVEFGGQDEIFRENRRARNEGAPLMGPDALPMDCYAPLDDSDNPVPFDSDNPVPFDPDDPDDPVPF